MNYVIDEDFLDNTEQSRIVLFRISVLLEKAIVMFDYFDDVNQLESLQNTLTANNEIKFHEQLCSFVRFNYNRKSK